MMVASQCFADGDQVQKDLYVELAECWFSVFSSAIKKKGWNKFLGNRQLEQLVNQYIINLLESQRDDSSGSSGGEEEDFSESSFKPPPSPEVESADDSRTASEPRRRLSGPPLRRLSHGSELPSPLSRSSAVRALPSSSRKRKIPRLPASSGQSLGPPPTKKKKTQAAAKPTKRKRRRVRKSSLGEPTSGGEDIQATAGHLQDIVSTDKPPSSGEGYTGAQLVPYYVAKCPPLAFSWDQLTPGTKEHGQRGKSALVELMADKLVENPYSYLMMKKNLRVVAPRMSVKDLETQPPSMWTGPFFVQSGGQHVRGVQLAMSKDKACAAVLSGDAFRPKFDLYTGKNMPLSLWQRLVTETQASEEVFSTWRFIDKIDIGRHHLRKFGKLTNDNNLSAVEFSAIAALFPKQHRKESLYANIRMMRCSEAEFKMMKEIDHMEQHYELKDQKRPSDMHTATRQIAEAKRAGISMAHWFKFFTKCTPDIRRTVFEKIISKEQSWSSGLLLMDLMKCANHISATLLYVLGGKKATYDDWLKLQKEFPESLGNPRINTLLRGGVTMTMMKFRKTAKDYEKERANLLTRLPASFMQVIKEVQDAREMAAQKDQVVQESKALIVESPFRKECKVWLEKRNCVTVDLANNLRKRKFKGFTASVNFGMRKYAGDDAPTTMDEVGQLIRNCHYLTLADEYFIMLSCRAEDREEVFKLLTGSVVPSRVFYCHIHDIQFDHDLLQSLSMLI